MAYKFRVFMKRDHRDFDSSHLRRAFLEDFSNLIGCGIDDIADVRILDGCVIVEGKINNEKHAIALALMYRARNNSVPSEEKELISRLLSEWGINGIDLEDWTLLLSAVKKRKAMYDRRVVLVHGWSGDSATFGNLASYLRDALGCDVLNYAYPTGVASHSPSLTYVAKHFADFLEQTVDAEKVAIICHSMGGLIVKKAISDEVHGERRIDNRVVQLTFIASPSDGVALAAIAARFPFLGSRQLQELDPKNPFLFDVGTKFQAWVDKRVPQYCTVRCMIGTGDSIVTAKNGSDFDSNPIVILGADHVNIVKPMSPDAEVVQRLVWVLRHTRFSE